MRPDSGVNTDFPFYISYTDRQAELNTSTSDEPNASNYTIRDPYAKHGTKENPIDVKLKYKPEWTEEQRAQADAKLKVLSEAYTEKSKPVKRDRYLKSLFLELYGLLKIPDGYDLDHIIDLQLGGLDDIMNAQLLDRSVNRSMGTQIMHAIADYEIGTVLGNFTIE